MIKTKINILGILSTLNGFKPGRYTWRMNMASALTSRIRTC